MLEAGTRSDTSFPLPIRVCCRNFKGNCWASWTLKRTQIGKSGFYLSKSRMKIYKANFEFEVTNKFLITLSNRLRRCLTEGYRDVDNHNQNNAKLISLHSARQIRSQYSDF